MDSGVIASYEEVIVRPLSHRSILGGGSRCDSELASLYR